MGLCIAEIKRSASAELDTQKDKNSATRNPVNRGNQPSDENKFQA